MLTREQIDAAADLVREEVAVPEWGGTVVVRTLSGTEREEFDLENARLRDAAPKGDVGWYRGFRLRLLVRALCGADGAPLYRPDEVDVLGRRNPLVLARLFDVADRLNAVTERAIEDRVGKSEAAPSGDSCSDSPSLSGTATPTSS